MSKMENAIHIAEALPICTIHPEDTQKREYDTYSYKIPTWALCYIINGDGSGLEGDEKEQVDNFLKEVEKECGIGHWGQGNGEDFTWEEAANMGCIDLVVDDHHGIYAPQVFARRFEAELRQLITQGNMWFSLQDLNILLEGPDNEFYWDVELNDITIEINGYKWNVHQDGAIYLVREDISLLEEDYREAYFSHDNDICSLGGDVEDYHYVVFRENQNES